VTYLEEKRATAKKYLLTIFFFILILEKCALQGQVGRSVVRDGRYFMWMNT